MSEVEHIAQVAPAGNQKPTLFASWCRCGWSCPLQGTDERARQKAREHFREAGVVGTIKGDT